MVLIRYVLMKNTNIHGITGTGIKIDNEGTTYYIHQQHVFSLSF